MTIAIAQAYMHEHRELLEDAGFVAVVYAGRPSMSFIKSIAVDQELAKVLQSTDEIPENMHDIWDAEEEFSLVHPPENPQPVRDRNFIVVEIAADGMVKRINGVGGRIEGPFALGSEQARKVLKGVGAELPLMDEEIEAPSLKAVPA